MADSPKMQSLDEQINKLQDIGLEDLFGTAQPEQPLLPSSLPEQPKGLPDFDPFDFGQAQQEAQEAQRGMGGDESALLEAIRELPERIAEALRNG